MEGATSRGRECARDHSLVESPVSVTKLTLGAAMRRDAQVKWKKKQAKKKNKHELIYSKNIFVLSYYAVHVSCFLMIILQN